MVNILCKTPYFTVETLLGKDIAGDTHSHVPAYDTYSHVIASLTLKRQLIPNWISTVPNQNCHVAVPY